MKKKIKPTLKLTSVSVSRLLMFASCHRKYYFHYIRDLVQAGLHIPFYVGSMIHFGNELFYNRMKPSLVLKKVGKRMDKYLKDYFVPPEQTGDVDIQRAVILGMMKGYMTIYAKEPKLLKNVETEGFYQIKMDGHPELSFVGRLDMKAKIKKDLWIFETKTSSRIVPEAIERLSLDLQVQCYPKLIEDEKPKGIVYNMIRKPSIRQKKNERFDEFTDRIAELYTIYPQDYFFRKKVPFKQKYINEAWEDVTAMTEELCSYYEFLGKKVIDKKEWYRNSYSCFDFGSTCPYFRLCQQGECPAALSMFADRKDMYDK